MRALVADDEPLARRGIRQLLEEHDDVEVVAEATNGVDTVTAIAEHCPDLVFLDVQMPGMDGFEVVRKIGIDRMPAVVFVTAFDEFAVQAFEAAAIDYLMKPVGSHRFATALQRVRDRSVARTALAQATELRTLLSNLGRSTLRIPITTSTGGVLIEVGEIDWIEADDYYAVIHAGGRRHLLRESLNSLEERLPRGQFIRVHRSALVAVDRIRAVDRGAVVCRDGTRVEISRRRASAVAALMRDLSD